MQTPSPERELVGLLQVSRMLQYGAVPLAVTEGATPEEKRRLLALR